MSLPAGPKGCQFTMGGDKGVSSYYECDKPAKFLVKSKLRGLIRACGIHARNKEIVPMNNPDQLPKLFSRRNDGSIHTWQVQVRGGKYRTIAGLFQGAKVRSRWTVCKAKNVGRSNATTPEEQALAEAKAMWLRKTEKGYTFSRGQVDAARNKLIKPMLAKKYGDYVDKLEPVHFPLMVQPKLDGMRCLARKDGLWSRRQKAILSAPHIHEALRPFFEKYPNAILDGELYNHDLKTDFDQIVSLCRKGKPTAEALRASAKTMQYHIYDCVSNELFGHRWKNLMVAMLHAYPGPPMPKCLKFVETDWAMNPEEIDELYAKYLKQGYEGIMVRAQTPYIHHRTKNLLKRKERLEEEFRIVDVLEGDGNRSGMAGRIKCALPGGGEFQTGIKGCEATYREMLKNRKKLIGQRATVMFQNWTPGGKPRFPVTKCIRGWYE